MKFAHIIPLKNLDQTHGHDYNMFLTHLVETSAAYGQFASKQEGYKILDNSLIELGDAVSIERIVTAAHRIGADEIILPDAFLNCDETIKRVDKALWDLQEFGRLPFKLMAVVQGRNEEEWLKCFEVLNNIPIIDTLGIPKVTATLHPKGRAYFVNNLPKIKKEIHLLGIWDNVYEFDDMDISKVRGVDSSLPALLAIKGKDLRELRAEGEIINLETDCASRLILLHYMTEVNKYVAGLSRI